MRALVYSGPGRMVVADLPLPHPTAAEVQIAVTTAAICGLDLAAFRGLSHSHTPPLVLGHECVGRTPEGTRVVVNPFICCGACAACQSGAHNLCRNWRLLGLGCTPGCHAEHLAVPASHITPISDGLSDERAVLAEPLANIVHLFRLAPSVEGQRIGIIGAGTMGALALQLALHARAKFVLVEDVNEARLCAARAMGATAAVNVAEPSGHAAARGIAAGGLDIVLDASGTAAARQSAFSLCRPGGVVVLLGMAAARSELDFAASIRQEHRVVMSFGYTPADFAQSLALLATGAVDLTPWTACLPLQQGQRAFERISVPGETLRMLLRVS